MTPAIQIAICGAIFIILINLVWYWGYQEGKQSMITKIEKIRKFCFHEEEPCGSGPCTITTRVYNEIMSKEIK